MTSNIKTGLVCVVALASAFSMASAAETEQAAKPIMVSKADAAWAASPQIVSASIAIAIDASASVDAKENADMLDGIKASFLDHANDYHECIAATVIRFAYDSYTGPTHVICSRQGVEDFVNAELSYTPGQKPSDFYKIGSGTSIGSGIQAVRKVFEEEKTTSPILAERRAVVFIGDGPNLGHGPLQNDIDTLAQTYGATSYAIPIADRDEEDNETDITRTYYRDNLVTPAGFTYVDKAVFGNRPLRVSPGVYTEATDFKAVGKAFEYVLQVGQF